MKTNLQRIETIDIFRGFTLMLMILVNNPGDWSAIYSPLKHANWNGLSLADLVFPFFLFIMGLTIPFLSISKLNLIEISKRSLLLISLGLILNLIPKFDLNSIRIPGVLQRIGLVYFFSCLVFKISKNLIFHFFVLFILLFIHSYLLYLPFGEIDSVKLLPNQNFSNYLDNLILKNHLWEFSKTWDPEGILGTISSIASSISGIIFGLWIIDKKNKFQIILIFFLFLILILPFEKIIPINKSLWTASYVLVTSFIGIIFYFILELSSILPNKLLILFGQNSLFLFFYTSLFAKFLNLKFFDSKLSLKNYLFSFFFKNNFEIYFASFLWSVLILFIFYLILKFKEAFSFRKDQ